MEFKGTKGYWHLASEEAHEGEYEAYELDINFGEGHVDCATVYCDAEIPTEVELADARLMAAAPELLKACIEFMKDFDGSKESNEKTRKQMNNAINKALNGDFKNT